MSMLVSAIARPFSEVASQASELGDPNDEIFSEYGDRTAPAKRPSKKGSLLFGGLLAPFQPKDDQENRDAEQALAGKNLNKLSKRELVMEMGKRINTLHKENERLMRELSLAQDALKHTSREMVRLQANVDESRAEAHELENTNTVLQLVCSITSLLAICSGVLLAMPRSSDRND